MTSYPTTKGLHVRHVDGDAGKRYRGMDAVERSRQRRAAIAEAAADLFARLGYRHTSVKHICDHAGLTQRYFYESFDDRQAALAAVYDQYAHQMRTETLAAVASSSSQGDLDVIANGLRAFIGFLTADIRRAQIMLIEVVGVSVQMEQRRHAVLTEFVDMVMAVWWGHTPPTASQRLICTGLVGAVNHVLIDWLLSGQTQQPSELVQACMALFAGARSQLWPQ